MDNVSPVDIAVRQCLYYPDGARRRPLRSEPVDEIRDSKLQLVHALVDKYNEDNNLFGVCSLSPSPALIPCPVICS
jgi:hypothetical protein